MATTSRALCKRVEDVEIFQVLEENTDSDVTIFSSEEEEDGNVPDSDEDGQLDVVRSFEGCRASGSPGVRCGS